MVLPGENCAKWPGARRVRGHGGPCTPGIAFDDRDAWAHDYLGLILQSTHRDRMPNGNSGWRWSSGPISRSFIVNWATFLCGSVATPKRRLTKRVLALDINCHLLRKNSVRRQCVRRGIVRNAARLPRDVVAGLIATARVGPRRLDSASSSAGPQPGSSMLSEASASRRLFRPNRSPAKWLFQTAIFRPSNANFIGKAALHKV
jgi:hypothetical protein